MHKKYLSIKNNPTTKKKKKKKEKRKKKKENQRKKQEVYEWVDPFGKWKKSYHSDNFFKKH